MPNASKACRHELVWCVRSGVRHRRGAEPQRQSQLADAGHHDDACADRPDARSRAREPPLRMQFAGSGWLAGVAGSVGQGLAAESRRRRRGAAPRDLLRRTSLLVHHGGSAPHPATRTGSARGPTRWPLSKCESLSCVLVFVALISRSPKSCRCPSPYRRPDRQRPACLAPVAGHHGRPRRRPN